MNDNINMDSTISGSMNDNINMDSISKDKKKGNESNNCRQKTTLVD
jgi:hypothetical protein